MKKAMTLFILSSILLIGCSSKEKENPKEENKTTTQNPFMVEWDTPYGVPPFDQIKTSDYLPAFEEGMRQQMEEINAIINNSEEPSFENTVLALENSGNLLNKVSSVFFNLVECLNNPEMKAIATEIYPKMSVHSDSINMNPQLFARIKAVYDAKDAHEYTPEELRLIEETYKMFVRGGANVPADKQERFREINQQLSLLTLTFGDNVLKATNDYKLVVDDKARLEGMPEDQLAAALEAGNADEATKGKYVFTIHLPSMEPFLMNCKDRELRHELWTAYSTRCTSGETDNRDIINQIINLRLERAQILGYKSHADYTLEDCMAKTPMDVLNLLYQVWRPALAKAKKEAAEYQKMIKAEGNNFKLEPWDWRYYSEQLRKEKYDLNDEIIRPYLSLNNVKEGVFMVANKLYGITFEKNNSIPIYHPDVEAYEVKENGKTIAILYMDYYPRDSKRSGAWMTNFREQYMDAEGNNVIPVVSLVFNFTKPTADKPSLLNFDETETFFHEFGHGLHSIFSKCRFRSLSGTNVSRDFVELPSQIMENWASEPEVLRLYAKHYKTGEVIPEELIKKIEDCGTYGQGFINTELIAASLLDMHYHITTSPMEIQLPEYEDRALAKIGLIPEIISRYRSTYFQHIFSGGYSAGYYSYTWAAVLDSDAFEAFKENGLFDQETAKAFRTNILERGNTDDAMKLYVAFRGKQPSINPLLKKRGLK